MGLQSMDVWENVFIIICKLLNGIQMNYICKGMRYIGALILF